MKLFWRNYWRVFVVVVVVAKGATGERDRERERGGACRPGFSDVDKGHGGFLDEQLLAGPKVTHSECTPGDLGGHIYLRKLKRERTFGRYYFLPLCVCVLNKSI